VHVKSDEGHSVNRLFVLLSLVLLYVISCAAGVVAVDQAGYMTGGRKIAVLTSYADSFQVVNAATRAIVFRGAVGFVSLGDPSTGLELYGADFSAVSAQGEYVLSTGVGDSSVQFSISDTVYQRVYRSSLKGFFFQRCGTQLPVSNAGPWWHAACHTASDGMFHAVSESTGVALVAGGWHDAGDYGKYIVNAGISVGTLLMAYEYFPSQFSADNLQIPESGNGVPDILDEVRYELNWFFTMQASGGGVFFKVTKPQFEAFVMPNNDPGQRYIYRLSSTATGDFAAVMARAARIYKAFDTTFAVKCLQAASKAWGYLMAHPSLVPAGGFKNPAGTATGEYGDGDDSDERLWAAAELYLASGDTSAHAYFLANYASKGIITGAMSWPNVRTLAECTYLRGSIPGINGTVRGTIRQSLLNYCQTVLALRDNSGFRNALGAGEYYWGSNSQVLNNAVLLILGKHEGGAAEWEQAALEQLHYVLGVNAHGLSFVTGLGARSVLHPHHRPSGADGVVPPVPGLLAGGPNHNISDDPVLAARFTSSTPPALCYVDDQGSYASNEICINWNAPLVFVAGYFAQSGTSASLLPPAYGVPAEFQLSQNYPNPFNPTTVVRYQLPVASGVRLVIYDLLGREVAVLVDEMRDAGVHEVKFDGTGFSSGAYFYRMRVHPLDVAVGLDSRSGSGEFVKTMALLLLR
jgi:endoglucanase